MQEVEEFGGVDGVLGREKGAGQEEVLEEGEDGLVLLGRVRAAEPAGVGGEGWEEIGLFFGCFLVGVGDVGIFVCFWRVSNREMHTYMHPSTPHLHLQQQTLDRGVVHFLHGQLLLERLDALLRIFALGPPPLAGLLEVALLRVIFF